MNIFLHLEANPVQMHLSYFYPAVLVNSNLDHSSERCIEEKVTSYTQWIKNSVCVHAANFGFWLSWDFGYSGRNFNKARMHTHCISVSPNFLLDPSL